MSRFVSAGAINAETGEATAAAAGEQAVFTGAGGEAPKKNAEWEAVQKELEADRRRREEARVKAVEGGERSLYDVLQANKAAKQAAFEEQNKIKNQFRPLDDDEIEFLDDVREAKRKEEERVRRETEEGIAKFRRAQTKRPGGGEGEVEDEGGVEKGGEGGEEEWAVGPRKRRRKERGFGVKREKVEGGDGKGEEKTAEGKKEEVVKETPKASPPAKLKVGLVAYESDSDDD
ncbi:hypothetical protein CkaCkLH20_08894 [Colletotrichum karsti]|uniref:FAM192A/Fyv6 N-terminal domain-containing protein n=1 Tax=Colletotrichum karsti TaxID=1095194 RepID=A0A9P6I007_9PEZI|nr:uncharacterized protein CkaCkLH20_08894 [Colletotrichum karsti]KAF9873784.1 hypothetical protein CkaCkLH20_08894 [Colletotrichum karsti]